MDGTLAQPSTPPQADRRSALLAKIWANLVAWLSVLLAVGSALLVLGHAGIDVPFVSGLGPGGDRVVLPAAIAFGVATAAATLVAVGAFRRRSWAWALGLVVHGVVAVGAAMPYRGIGSLAGIVIGVAAIATLLSRPGRDAFLVATG